MDESNETELTRPNALPRGGAAFSRRTALKLTGAGLVGSTAVPEIAFANEVQLDATFHLFTSVLDILGDPAPHLINITEDTSTGRTITTHGSGLFAQDGTDVSGGGSFIVRDDEETVVEEGTWTADEVVEWDPYGAGDALPDTWKGGYLELEASYSPSPDGISASDTLLIECHEGATEDQHRFDVQGVRVGNFDTVTPTNFATIFHFDENEEM